MKKAETFTIIDGNFTYDEANEILPNMISSKINYYNINNWSAQVRFGKDDAIAQKRIPALRNEMKKLENILLEAKAKNLKLVVSSEINILLMEDECSKEGIYS